MAGDWRDVMPRGVRSLALRLGDPVIWASASGGWRRRGRVVELVGAMVKVQAGQAICRVPRARLAIDIADPDGFSRALRWTWTRAGRDIPVGKFDSMAVRHAMSATTEADLLVVAEAAALAARTERELAELEVVL